jgi:hypothetical protein
MQFGPMFEEVRPRMLSRPSRIYFQGSPSGGSPGLDDKIADTLAVLRWDRTLLRPIPPTSMSSTARAT